MAGKKSNVHVWIPDLLSSTGGIQAYCQHFIKALYSELSLDSGRVLVKNDPPDILLNVHNIYKVSASGHWSRPYRTPLYALDCLLHALIERPSVIVSMHLHFGPLAQVIRRSLNIPYVLMAYGIEAWQINSAARQTALRNADLVLAISHYTRDWLINEGGVNPGRVQILAPTFISQQFSIGSKSPQLLQKYGFTPQTPVIMTVCRLVEEERYKGYDQIIKAMPDILQALPDARYLLIGKGPDRLRIERLIAEVGVQSAVTLAGFVPDEELAEHYNLCDVFAMPSKAEGFGIVYLEALACGKPVVAGNKDGSRDALANGELGVLVDPDDVGEITQETIRILKRQHSHPCIYERELLRKRVIELFGFDNFSRTLVEHLGGLLAVKNGSGSRFSKPQL